MKTKIKINKDTLDDLKKGVRVKLYHEKNGHYCDVDITFQTPQPKAAADTLAQFVMKACDDWQEYIMKLNEKIKETKGE